MVTHKKQIRIWKIKIRNNQEGIIQTFRTFRTMVNDILLAGSQKRQVYSFYADL